MEEVIGGWIREGVPSAETERVSKIPRGEIVVSGINQGGNKLYSLIADFFEFHSSLKLWKNRKTGGRICSKFLDINIFLKQQLKSSKTCNKIREKKYPPRIFIYQNFLNSPSVDAFKTERNQNS